MSEETNRLVYVRLVETFLEPLTPVRPPHSQCMCLCKGIDWTRDCLTSHHVIYLYFGLCSAGLRTCPVLGKLCPEEGGKTQAVTLQMNPQSS